MKKRCIVDVWEECQIENYRAGKPLYEIDGNPMTPAQVTKWARKNGIKPVNNLKTNT